MRPLGIGETLDAGVKLTRDHILPLVLIVLVVTIPIEILAFLISSSTSEVQDGAATATDDGTYLAGQGANLILRQAATTFVTIGCFHVIAEAYLGRDATAGQSLAFAARRLHKILWTGVVLIGLSIVAFVLLVIPLFWFYYAAAFAFPVLMVEGTFGFAAVKRSFSLVKDRWWATAGRLFIAGMIAGVTAGLLGVVLLIPFAVLTPDSVLGILGSQSLAQIIASAITLPFVSAVTIVTYFDLRVRKEGFDLALLAEKMGGGAAGPSPFAQPASPSAPAPAPGAEGSFGGFAPPSAPSDSPERPG